jgi:dihydroflavonol-4-reductase
MKALVTGATGFIGSHVVRALLDAGWQVRALVRLPDRGTLRRAELPVQVERMAGDVRDPQAVKQAVNAVDAVFHVAALYELWTPDPQVLYEVNVEGTRTVLEAARNLQRVVYTSSVSTVTPGGDETAYADPTTVHSHYKRSKIFAERVAREYANTVIVNPSTPIGSGDVRPTPTGKVILDFLRGRLPAYVDTGLNLIDVEDVAQGHLLAYNRGQPGERYILGNENVTLKAMLHMLAAETGRQPPALKLPLVVAYAAGAVSEVLEGRLARRPPSVPLEGVRMARVPMYYDASRARRELGLPQSPIRLALRKAAEWFQANGYC